MIRRGRPTNLPLINQPHITLKHPHVKFLNQSFCSSPTGACRIKSSRNERCNFQIAIGFVVYVFTDSHFQLAPANHHIGSGYHSGFWSLHSEAYSGNPGSIPGTTSSFVSSDVISFLPRCRGPSFIYSSEKSPPCPHTDRVAISNFILSLPLKRLHKYTYQFNFCKLGWCHNKVGVGRTIGMDGRR